MARLLKIIAKYITLSAIAAILVLLEVFPTHPTTASGWGLLLVLALPLTIVGELVGEALWRNRLAQAVEAGTKERSFSVLRVLYTFCKLSLSVSKLSNSLFEMVSPIMPRPREACSITCETGNDNPPHPSFHRIFAENLCFEYQR